MGVNYTIKRIREKFLVIYVRQEVKQTNKDCSECVRRFKVQPVQQQMAPVATHTSSDDNKTLHELRSGIRRSIPSS